MVGPIFAMIEMQIRSKVNSIRRESWIGHLFSIAFALSIAASALFVFLIGLVGGALLAKESSDFYYQLAWNGITAFFVIAWVIYYSNDLLRSDGIPLQRLMHLPISPAQAFALNYFQNWLNLPMLYFLLASGGLILGGSLFYGPMLLWQFLPVFLYVLMFTSITSLVQARIAVWLQNPKTRRLVLVLTPAIVGLLSFAFALSSNAIRDRLPLPKTTKNATELISQKQEEIVETSGDKKVVNQRESASSVLRREELARTLYLLDVLTPPLWLAGCYFNQYSPTTTSWVLIGVMLSISTYALRSNYALTLKYYLHGFESELPSGKLKPHFDAESHTEPERKSMELKIPGLDETYSAIVSMSWLSLSRSPEIKLSILLPMMQPIILMIIFGRRGGPENPYWQFASLLSLAALGLFLSSGFLCNLFGIDRAGFRFWVLSPISRETILHARNIAYGLPALFLSLAMGLGIAIFWNVRLVVGLELTLGLLAFFPLYLLVANIMSILAPFPLPPGGLHPKEFSWKTLALNLLLTASLPIIMLWCCVPIGLELLVQWFWPKFPSGPLALLGLALVFWRSWTFYHQNLPNVGGLLQAREIDLLKTVTMHVEKK